MRHVLLRACLGVFVALMWTACATTVREPESPTGWITVGVRTTGSGISGLRFGVSIEPAGVRESVAVDAGVFTARAIPAGTHRVRLMDVPARCRVDGGPERTIEIAGGRGAAVRFMVSCE